jgi:hypothetical protein
MSLRVRRLKRVCRLLFRISALGGRTSTAPDVCENPYEPNTAEALAWTANWFQEKQDLEESVLALCHERGRLGK